MSASPVNQSTTNKPKAAKLSAGDNKFILFTHHLVNSLDFLGDIVKQQILDSVVYAPVEDQQSLLCEFVTKEKQKEIAKAIVDQKKQNIIDAKLAEKQAKIDEKKRLKEEKENAKKQEKQRLKEETRAKKELEKAEKEKKKKELKQKNSKNSIVVSENMTATETVTNDELQTEKFVSSTPKLEEETEEKTDPKSPSLVKKAIKKRTAVAKKKENKKDDAK
jgi:hypothetical protein